MAGEQLSPGDPTDPRARRQRIVDRLHQVIDEGSHVSMAQIGRDFGAHKSTVSGIALRAGLRGAMQDLRREPREDLFPQTPEVAWFMGMMFGTSGSVKTDASKSFLEFISDSQPKLDAFRNSGESILRPHAPGIAGIQDVYDKNTNPSVRFNSTAHAVAIGDFHKDSKAYTLRARHAWVLEEPFLPRFVSGFFDSGGIIMQGQNKREIDFYTNDQVTAEFYRALLRRIGVKANIMRRAGGKVDGVQVNTVSGLRTFAQTVTSVDSEIQETLNGFKDLAKEKKRPTHPESVAQIAKEWRRLTEVVLDHPPSSPEIKYLRGLDETLFPVTVYIKFFGAEHEGDRRTFATARRQLTQLMTLDQPAYEQRLAALEAKFFPKEKQVYP